MTDITIPSVPVFVYYTRGNRVNEVARYAEVIADRYGRAEAAGLLEAHCIGGAIQSTLVFIADRCAEFGRFMDGQPHWVRVRRHNDQSSERSPDT